MGCAMFGMWDVWDMGSSGCGCLVCAIFGMWNVSPVRCWQCGMLEMWDICDEKRLLCGMFRTGDVLDVGCLGFGCLGCAMFAMLDIWDGMWDVACGMFT